MFSLPAYNSNTSHVILTKRLLKDNDISAFGNELSKYNWRAELVGDFENCFDTYLDKFQYLYNKHFPIKQIIVKEKHIGKPYITVALKNSIRHRNRLQKLYAKWPVTYERAFKAYRKRLTNLIRTAKENYYKEKLQEQTGDPKKNLGNSEPSYGQRT